MIVIQSFGGGLHQGHKARAKRACVVECGGRDAAFARMSHSQPSSSQCLYHEDQPIASPSPGGEGRGEGELSVAEARGSNFSVLNPVGFIGDLLVPLRIFSPFPSLKTQNLNLKISQYTRASGGTPQKSDLNQIKLNWHKKISQFFSASFIRNHWETMPKPSKKHAEIMQKNRHL